MRREPVSALRRVGVMQRQVITVNAEDDVTRIENEGVDIVANWIIKPHE